MTDLTLFTERLVFNMALPQCYQHCQDFFKDLQSFNIVVTHLQQMAYMVQNTKTTLWHCCTTS